MVNNRIILVDTSILIGLQRANPDIVTKFTKLSNSIHISRISACELVYGSRNTKEKKINKSFLANFPIIEIEADISHCAYILLDKYTLKNKFGIADSLLASTAIINKYAFWTSNVKHFRQIKELSLYNV